MTIIATQGNTMFTMLKKLKRSQSALSNSSLGNSNSGNSTKPGGFRKFLFSLFLLVSSLGFSLQASADYWIGDCLVISPIITPGVGTTCPGEDLNGADFTGVILSYANFQNAILTNVDFYGATLFHANFEGADWTGATFSGGVQWNNTICPNGTNSDQYTGNGCVGTFADDDNDGVRNDLDAFPDEEAASVDSDADGYPDYWNKDCDLTCQSGFGLSLDMFPFNNAASQDADKDGFPEVWNNGTGGTFNCDATCRANSGLALDVGQHAAGAIFVDASRPWAGATGLSWGTAWPTIRDALAVVTAGQEIWIARGVYYPDEVAGNGPAGTNSPSDAFNLVNHTALVGGFVGGETLASEANPKLNPVVLSGDIDKNDSNKDVNGVHTGFESAYNHNGTNSHSVVNSSSVIARMTGLIISGGGSGIAGNSSGGGIYCVSTTLTLQKVKMVYNRAITEGGAIFCSNTNTKLVMEDVVIDNNYSGTSGGGILFNLAGKLEMYRSSITNNRANIGGGINLSNGARAIITNSTIANNIANNGGGIVVHGSGSITAPKNLSMSFSTLAYNSATVNIGGGMYAYNFADVELKGTVVVGNTAANAGGNVYRTANDVFSAQHSTFGSSSDGLLSLAGTPVGLATFLNAGANPTVSIPGVSTPALIDSTLINLGGFTSLFSFPPSSQLRNAIPDMDCKQFTGAMNDQRGFMRPYIHDGNNCDIGAFELNDFDSDGFLDNLDSDIDGDTMPNDFETTHGLNPYNPADATLDPDGDTIPNNADAFPNNIAASVDNDGDGYPDFFNPGCDSTCQSTSGLDIDKFPFSAAAAFDSDDDGFPDSWLPGCNATCQTNSGLALDAGQLYVDINRPWSGSNGLSWTTAFPNVADALAVAGPGQEIWIAQGVYYPDEASNNNTNSANATFTLKNNVNLVGGFWGNETQRDQANPSQYLTILSGDITQNDFNRSGGVGVGFHTGYQSGNTHNSLNSHVIVTANFVSSRLIGLIISGGGSGTGGNEFGAGIKCSNSNLRLQRVKLLYNRVTSDGGAIYCMNGGSHQVVLEEVEIKGSYAGNRGGGVFVQNGFLDISHSTIAYNTANSSGGGISQFFSKSSIRNSTIAYNSTSQQGGGIHINGTGVISGQKDLQMNFSTVAFNNSSVSNGGGGLYTTNFVDAEVTGSVFVGNTAPVSGANVYRNNSDVFNADYSSFGSSTAGGLSLQGSNANIATFLSSGMNLTVTIPALNTASLINSALIDNGSFTPTLAIPSFSDYRNAIPAANCLQIFGGERDQRGILRPYQYDTLMCDLGAFELNDFDLDAILDNFDIDIDGDGLPNTWEMTYGLNSYDPTDATLDFDGDTLTNLQEYSLNTHPFTPDSSYIDEDFTLSPRYHRYGFESVNCQTEATPVLYTVNNNTSWPRVLGPVDFTFMETGDWELVSGQDTCSNQTLSPYTTCTFEVVFCSNTPGNKTGIIEIANDDLGTPILTSALYNFESDQDEAQRRLPPVLSNLVIRDSSLNVITNGEIKGGEDHTFEWTITGYHADYQSLVAAFNCNLVAAGTCGLNYSSNYDNSGVLSPDIIDVGTWTYNGIVANTYTYTTTFNLPYNVAESNEWVLRFYQNPLEDLFVNNSSLSLMIPGNIMEAAGYYDSSGRRIIINVIE